MLLSCYRKPGLVRFVVAAPRRSRDSLPCGRFGVRARAEGGDLLSEVLGVVLDKAKERRAAGVLPWEPQEVEPRRAGHAALMDSAAIVVEYRRVDPGVVAAEAGGPDN